MNPRPNVDLVWFAAGGGHRAAALALEQVMHEQGRPWNVRRVNLTEVLDPSERFRRATGIAPEDVYNKRLATGFTLGLKQELKLLQGGIRLAHRMIVQRLALHWRTTRPDVLVSLIPNFNAALHDSLALACPGVPFMTVMTDMADHPPHFWIEPDVQQHIVCGTGHAVQQAMAAGVPDHRVHRVDGMILRPEFHRMEAAVNDPAAAQARATQRVAAGLPDTGAVGLVLFGGTGSRAMLGIEAALHEVPLILICGRNEALAAALREQAARPAPGGGPRAARAVVGFTAEVAQWMRLAEFFIGKPGPGSLSEAVQCGLPVIVTRNAMTMPQERWNTVWVEQMQVGVVLRRFADVKDAVTQVLDRLPELQARVRAVHNAAVFQVPDLIAGLMAGRAADGNAERIGAGGVAFHQAVA
jgi:UDP-N-acetylglucosamine:LPS N-acetylglucosamine transferase